MAVANKVKREVKVKAIFDFFRNGLIKKNGIVKNGITYTVTIMSETSMHLKYKIEGDGEELIARYKATRIGIRKENLCVYGENKEHKSWERYRTYSIKKLYDALVAKGLA